MKLVVTILLGLVLGCNAYAADDAGHVELTAARVLQQDRIPVYNYKVIQTYPHDRTSYTEGLQMVDGVIYEGTGLYGQSKIRKWDLRSGRVLAETRIGERYFGEGVTVLGHTAYELTYIENTGCTYDKDTLRPKGSFRFPFQGWGLTNDGRHLIMSNGSSAILFLDPDTRDVKRRIFVNDDVGPVGFLNELEFAEGKLYANVWQTDFIAIIRPDNCKIAGWIDLTGLNPDPSVLVYPLVLNGIAYDKATGHLLVTGKCWPNVYEITLVARPK
jgi:glutaminyl-peptide cyclotransferase